MEEPEQKRFRTDDEAMRFVQEVTQGRALPPQLWLKILANDPELHVVDIQTLAMIEPSGVVMELAKSGAIWEAIIRRQFGQEELDYWKTKRPFILPLELLIGLRLVNYLNEEPVGIQTRTSIYGLRHVPLTFSGTKALFFVDYPNWIEIKKIDMDIWWALKRVDRNVREVGTRFEFERTNEESLIIDLVANGFRPRTQDFKDKAYMGACAFCGAQAPNLPICSGCDSVAYCGEECAEGHWREGHHEECKNKE